MYLEALSAIDRVGTVESLHVAAYELREFMNALPTVLDVPVASYPHMKVKVNELVAWFERESVKSESFSDGIRSGDIDGHAGRLLEKLGEFAMWWRTNVPSRRHEIKAVLRELTPIDRPMPEVLWDARSGQWSNLLGYFQGVTHHQKRPALDEFLERLGLLEEFLLDYLEPRTFEDLDEIDSVIAEAEGTT